MKIKRCSIRRPALGREGGNFFFFFFGVASKSKPPNFFFFKLLKKEAPLLPKLRNSFHKNRGIIFL